MARHCDGSQGGGGGPPTRGPRPLPDSVPVNSQPWQDAERLFLKALADAELFGPSDPRLGGALCNLAELYRTMGQHANAEPLYLRGLQNLERTLGGKHPLLGMNTHYFAAALAEAGKLEEAMPFYQRALRIKGQSVGEKHREYGSTLYHIAELHRRQGQVREAVPLLEQAVAIAEEGQGWRTPKLARLSAVQWRNRLAEALAVEGRADEAVALQRDARRQLDGWGGPTCSYGEIIMANEGLAEALWRAGERQESEAITSKDLAELRENGPAALLAGRLRTLATLDISQSRQWLEEAVQVSAADDTIAGRLELLRALMALGKMEFGAGNEEAAKECYARAKGLAVQEKRFKEIMACEAALGAK